MTEKTMYTEEEAAKIIFDAGDFPVDFFNWMIGQDVTIGFDMKPMYSKTKVDYWLSRRKAGTKFPAIIR